MSKTSTHEYAVTVDYTKTAEELLNASGIETTSAQNFCVVHQIKTEKKAVVNEEVTLVNFHCWANYENLRDMVREMGLRPADFHETIAFCQQHPEAQLIRQKVCEEIKTNLDPSLDVISMGTIIKYGDSPNWPYYYQNFSCFTINPDGSIAFRLRWMEDTFTGGCYFLAVKDK